MLYYKCIRCGKLYPEKKLKEWNESGIVIEEHDLEGNITYKESNRKYINEPTVTWIQCSYCGETITLKPATVSEVEKAYERGEIEMPTSIEELKPIDLPSYDPTPLIGKRVKIEKVTIEESPNPQIIKHPHLRIETEVIGKAGEREIRATKLLGLYAQQKPDGSVEVGWGKTSKTASFLTAMKVTKPSELIGKEVIVITQTAKDGRKYATFDSP